MKLLLLTLLVTLISQLNAGDSSPAILSCSMNFQTLFNNYDTETVSNNNKIQSLRKDITDLNESLKIARNPIVIAQNQVFNLNQQRQTELRAQYNQITKVYTDAIALKQREIDNLNQRNQALVGLKKAANDFKANCLNPKPLPQICNVANSRDIMGTNNVYIKTACYVATALPYSSAEGVCQTNGMTLYQCTDQPSYDGLVNVANSIWKSSGASFWINGKKSGDGKWRSQPDNLLLHSGMNWLENPQPFNCLRLVIPDKKYGVSSFNCGLTMTSWCEFKKY